MSVNWTAAGVATIATGAVACVVGAIAIVMMFPAALLACCLVGGFGAMWRGVYLSVKADEDWCRAEATARARKALS